MDLLRFVGKFRVELLFGALPLGVSAQFLLLVVVDAQIFEPQLFAVQGIIDGAQDHEDAVERHGDDALHADEEVLHVLTLHVAAEGKFLQHLFIASDLHGRAEHNGHVTALDDAVIVEVGRDVVSDV